MSIKHGANTLQNIRLMLKCSGKYVERKMNMEKLIPYEKLSKKKRRELDLEKRGSWGEINPVTRKGENPKAYNRRKAQKWSDDASVSVLCI